MEATGSEAEAIRLLSAVGIPDAKRRMSSFPHELSGGLRQRVMIAMAVAGNPALIIADEPTTALDVTVQAQVLTLLRQLRDQIGCSVILVTHDLGVAAQIADRVAVMYAGRLAELGPTDEILSNASHPYTLGLMRSRLTLDTDRSRALVALDGEPANPSAPLAGCAFAPRCALATVECSSRPPEMLEEVPGHSRACIRDAGMVRKETGVLADLASRQEFPPPSPAAAESPLRVTNVTKTFTVGQGIGRRAKLHALRDVSLTVEPGESVAIVGESGSGKSTLLRVIASLERADSGTVDLGTNRPPQMVFQDAGASLTPWLTVGELIGERLRGQNLSRASRAAVVETALVAVGLPVEAAQARPAQMSGGQRQRVSLARATVVPPSILLCDEPTSALDVSLAATVINLIRELQNRLGMSVIFVTHDLSVARIIADRIAVMYLGRIVEIGEADQITRNPAHPYTQSLIASLPGLGKSAPPLRGEPASPLDPPTGCSFHPRCPIAVDACGSPELVVPLVARAGSTREVACIETTVI
jgi:peptide/nickel transport system ATP-binding protein